MLFGYLPHLHLWNNECKSVMIFILECVLNTVGTLNRHNTRIHNVERKVQHSLLSTTWTEIHFSCVFLTSMLTRVTNCLLSYNPSPGTGYPVCDLFS